ncbi:uncharacterized protein LOC127731019 [Mytilus californianus]|uniref:uncharacterized protein LOC127731019 n=1 Tax=Mytilus californianus TaxID=6549 RepID=UPI0022474509|nr:uncharacterized protein LOC127731019 [Mytilus californianus]
MPLLGLLFPVYSLMVVFTEGCMRSSNNSTESKMKYKVNNQTIPENHRLGCTFNETQTLACLNGGSCFAVEVGGRIVQCACYTKYVGNRCEMIDPEMIFGPSEKEKEVRIGLISGVTAYIILILIVVLVVIYCKKIKNRRKETSTLNTAGYKSDGGIDKDCTGNVKSEVTFNLIEKMGDKQELENDAEKVTVLK